MLNIGITILATNAYFILGIRFVKRFAHFYKGDKKITFYFFSDRDPKPYLPDDIDIVHILTRNSSWVDGTNLKFKSIYSLGYEVKSDYLFYFDADTNVNEDFTDDWFVGYMVGGQHYADQTFMKESKGFDRNPESKAYVPHDTNLPQTYFYGAFFGGTTQNMIDFCGLLKSYQEADRLINYEPVVNDESYINREFHYNRPTKVIPSSEFKFQISDKGGIGETRNITLDIEPLVQQALQLKNEIFDISNGKII